MVSCIMVNIMRLFAASSTEPLLHACKSKILAVLYEFIAHDQHDARLFLITLVFCIAAGVLLLLMDRYQSSLDLGSTTYELIRHLPLAKDVVLSARQELVMRLDGYCEVSHELFTEVIERIINDVLPVVRQSGLAGHAEYVTRSAFFSEHPVAIDMMVDVLTDRGFHVCYVREDSAIPERVDLNTGAISYSLRPSHKFKITFDARGPRDEIKALELAARMAESNASLQRDVRISHSVIPDHFGDIRQEQHEEELKAGRPGGQIVGFMGS
eukprot:GHRR01013665.1.p1 GENE.GHRR01013665.1~~GHRR01013665.1.p1  ORF type:complete len:269 (+),score=60.10 GHRR01013665.1:252-1058(+)